MAKEPMEKCPDCGGGGTVAGRYTDAAPIVCGTCGGAGVVAADKREADEVEKEVQAKPVGEAKPKEDVEADG